MLDPANDFNSPCYDDTFRRNFYFKEFNNTAEYFIELDYWIMREAFASRIGRALDTDVQHYDDSGGGERIFRDVSAEELALIKSRGYFLADENIDLSTSNFGDIYHVTELYVYAPQTAGSATVFTKYSTEVVNFPLLVNFDYNFSKKYLGSEVSYLCGIDEIGFVSADFALGDEFYIDRPEQHWGAITYYACRSSILTVSRREGNMVWAKASSFTNPYSGNTWTARDVVFDNRNNVNVYYWIKSPTRKFSERSLQVTVRKESSFHTEMPTPSERFFPKFPATGLESPQIDSGTTPTYNEYINMINSGDDIRPSPTNITEVYKGLWLREDFFTRAK